MTLADTLLRTFAERHPDDAASLLAERSPSEAATVLARLPTQIGSAVLEQTAAPVAGRALEGLDAGRAVDLLAGLPLERAAAILRTLEAGPREAFIAKLPKPDRLRALIAYPAGTAGSLMDPSVPAMPATLDVREARRQLDNLLGHLALELYLVDPRQHPVGVARLSDVLDPSSEGELAGIAQPVESVREGADLASLTAHPGWLHHGTIPVVDDHGRYLGAVRAERVRQAAHELVSRRAREGADAVGALGELYWLGLTALLSSLGQPRAKEAR